MQKHTMFPKPKIEYSHYQTGVFDWLADAIQSPTVQVGVVEAVAGSGKTTTLIECARRIPPGVSYCVASFNQHIKQELQAKGIQNAFTINSLGARLLRYRLPFAQIPERPQLPKHQQMMLGLLTRQKVADAIESRVKDKDLLSDYIKNFERLTHLVSCHCIAPDNAAEIIDLASAHSIDAEPYLYPSNLIKWWRQTNIAIAELKGILSHQDQLELPIYYGLEPRQKYQVILVDEYQDLSLLHLKIIRKYLVENGTILMVGDRKQGLYSWNGADANAVIDECRTFADVVQLPLSICYRCPSSHLNLVKKWVPQIEARQDAPKGEIYNIEAWEIPGLLGAGDLVLSRYAAPLVPLLIEAINRGVDVAIKKGGELAGDLKEIAKKAYKGDISSDLAEYLERRKTKLKGSALGDFEDKITAIMLVIEAESPNNLAELELAINKYFKRRITRESAIVSTIHKAKGLEAERVFVLDAKRLPKRWDGQTRREFEEEIHCAVVALTRATDTLFLCSGGIF